MAKKKAKKKVVKRKKRARKPRSIDSYIIAALRKVWRYSPARRAVKNRAKVGEAYRCESCQGLFERIEIDHIDPVGSCVFTSGPNKGKKNWNEFIERLNYVQEDNLRALCRGCHKEKSVKENAERRKAKAKEKE